ncbi:hypothetical protein CERSUDRAFT_86861 [Gelatoporia subvermispora B]|uniref:Uncharacterized protein n=1 Tax=Ceriporiopsis subvermispora (strain B) TaxID=914234 RepID=M2QAV9_CERS8|nr:hypothetical protein CERSUDRAFT_86861 [Gelatoporia subvermispora B]
MSFSTPSQERHGRKLQRTGSYLSLADMQAAPETPLYGRRGASQRTTRSSREQRRRAPAPQPVAVTPAAPPPSVTTSFTLTTPPSRASSPLAPQRCPRPARACFPRSKPEPDLYRVAITTRMRKSPEGQKILHMGPRLALSILTATKDLERMVAAQREREGDVAMTGAEGTLSNSWVVVPGEDWEMVDCGA